MKYPNWAIAREYIRSKIYLPIPLTEVSSSEWFGTKYKPGKLNSGWYGVYQKYDAPSKCLNLLNFKDDDFDQFIKDYKPNKKQKISKLINGKLDL